MTKNNKGPLLEVEAVKRYVTGKGRRYQLIPLHRWDYVDPKSGKDRGKSPRDSVWQNKAYDSGSVLAECEAQGTNVGVRLRHEDLILDVDPRNFPEGRDSLFDLEMEIGLDLSTFPHVVTGSGGHHYYMTKPADVSVLDSLKDFPGLEFKSYGRQVVAAGSKHPSGGMYRWDDGNPGLDSVPPIPDRMLRLITRPVMAHGQGFGAGELTCEQLAETLEQIPIEECRDHDKWRDVMMAAHHATNGEGRQEFIDWSTSDPAYHDHSWIVGRRWDSLHTDTGPRPVTARYLHKVVQEHGGQVPFANPEDDFEAYVENEGVIGADGKPRMDEERVSILDEMNAKHCVVNEGGKFRIFTESFDPVLKRQYYGRSTKGDFEDLYCNRTVEVGDKLVPLGHWWVRQGMRRQYNGVIFDPERTHEGWLNLWRGWAVQPSNGGRWDLMKELIRDVLCDGDKVCYEYVMNWAAYMIQHPGRPAEVALCFRGEKGTGKGTFGRALSKLAGAHGLHISSPSHLTGRFNSHLKDCICLFADEAFWAGDKEGEAVLKQLVTEPTLMFEGKGQNAETGRNLIHVVIASNSDWVVPAGLDGERRFAVFEVSEGRQGDHEFFSRLHAQMESGGYEAMLYELLNRDIKGWAPRMDIPKTKAFVDQVLRSMSDVESWWFSKLMDGVLPNQRLEWHEEDTAVVKDYLRNDYLDYAKKLGVRRTADPIAFGMNLKRLIPGLLGRQVKATEDDVGITVDRSGRAQAYFIPSLQACREAFEKKLGGHFAW